MSSGKFLRSLRENKGFSLRQVSIKSGVSHTQIADIEKGVNYGTKEKLDKILMALGASGKEIEKFYDMQDYEKTPDSIKKKLEEKSKFEEVNTTQVQMIELPVYGRAAAGNGYINMENIIRTEYLVAIPGEDFPKGAFIAEVYGESMFPTLLDGDFAIVDPDCNDKNINNQICVVTYNGQTFIKRVVRKEKYVVLMSDNPDRVKYEDIIVPTDEYSDLVCHGIVIECRRKFKRR
ncbi:XRE family transcriptional regulator [Cetobacterium somerae]|uniref:XRE family transcriptional regulator n=1 Tax=Cetobacterium somerae TaxID=188913 RepID=UPI0038922C6E